MKKRILIIIYFLSIIIHAQVEPSVTFDPETGNYICRYEGEEQVHEVIFEPSTKVIPQVNFNIIDIQDSHFFTYNYELINSHLSKQRLRKFGVEIFSVISEISTPNENWLTGYYSFAPVFRWANSKGSGGLAHPLDGIAPDSAKSGFGFSSSGLPSISSTYFYGTTTTVLAFPDEPPGEISDLLKPLRKFPNDCVVKKTIGPRDALSPFIPEEFLDTLINYTTQSYDLGWISDEQTKTKYENYFLGAHDALVNLDTSSARTYLESVLKDADIDSSSAITSEAYALLLYNTEYLLKQLKQ